MNMKQFIKILAATLLSGFAFVSCNDDFDDATGGVNYPDGYELGMWAAQYTPAGGTAYSVNLTTNEEGDTICDLTYMTAAGKVNVFEGGKVTYNKKTGVITADYETSPYELPGRVTLAYRNDLKGYTVGVYTVDGDKLMNKGSFIAVAVDTIMVYGDWHLSNGSVMTLNPNGTVDVVNADGESAQGTYTFSGRSGQASVGNDTYTLSVNDKGQMLVSVNGGTAEYTSHIMTQPKNDWYEMAVGTYSDWLFGSQIECVLEYSESRAMARLYGFLPTSPQTCLEFYWTPGEYAVAMANDPYDTFYDHVQDGQMLGRVYAYPVAIDEAGNKAVFENDVFYFGMQFQIPSVGGFGADVDTYKVSGWLTE